jgi:polyisoprenyl-phosphate glycosyltransferase
MIPNLDVDPRTFGPVPVSDAVDVSVILPAFNEELAIGDDLDEIRVALEATHYSYEIMVVDDGSRDGTAAKVRERPWVRLIQHPHNRGNGAARTTGVHAARGRTIVFTDADRTYPNGRIPEMLALMDQGADMVIGARRIEAGTLRALRTPAKWFLRRLAEFLTGTRIPDLNSGLRSQRRDLTLRYLPLMPTTHSWVSTITIAFLSGGYNVQWLPIDYFPRVGRSTFHPIRDTYNYLSMVVRSVMYFDPLKVFLPLAVFLVGLGTLKYLLLDILWRHPDALRLGHIPSISGTTLVLLFTGLQVAVIGLLADLIVRRTRL